MKKNEVIKYYKKKIDQLKKHNKLYFDKSSPEISDKQFDEIKKEVIDLEQKFSFLKSPLSPSKL